MFGRPLVHPVDDIPDPLPETEDDHTRPLDILGDSLADQGYDLRHLIRTIAASRVFRLQSSHPALNEPDTAAVVESTWAAFPLTHLSPEQYIRSLQQASSITTLNSEHTGTVAALRRFADVRRFMQNSELSDADEVVVSGTVTQAVERLMGNQTTQLSRATPWTGPGRIALLSDDVTSILNTSYLACLTRLPTEPEREWFPEQLTGTSARQRARLTEDIDWSLYNSTEFCWNH